MPVGNVDGRPPARPVQADSRQRADAARTGRFGGREVTVGAGVDVPAPRGRVRVQSRRAGEGRSLLDRVVARLGRAGDRLGRVAARPREHRITWPAGRPDRPVDEAAASAAHAAAVGSPRAGSEHPVYENVDRPVYENVRPREQQAAAEPTYATVGDPTYATVGDPAGHDYESVPDLLDAVARLVGPDTPAEVADALRPICEEMRDLGAAMPEGNDDYEDMSRVYENLVAAMEPLVAGGQLDASDYVEIRQYENLMQVYANVGPPGEPQAAAEDEALYETVEEPVYETVGDPVSGPVREPDEPVYEPVPGLLDAVASLTRSSHPPEVAEAVQPLYEEMRDCAAAMRTGESDYEDMSRIYVNVLAAVEGLRDSGHLDDDTYVDMRVYQNRLDALAEEPPPGPRDAG